MNDLLQSLLKLIEQAAEPAPVAQPFVLECSGEKEVDRAVDYTETVAGDGRVIQHYTHGTVRVTNSVSGVIQEERADGSLVVSLPNGRVLHQQFPGDPLLCFDTQSQATPILARVAMVRLPEAEHASLVFHYQEHNTNHLVELDSLRYFRFKQR